MSDISKLSMQPAVTEMQLQDIVKRNYNLKVGILHRYEGYSDMNYRVETTISDDDDDNDDDDFDKKDKPVVTIKKLVLKILNREDSRFPECFGKMILTFDFLLLTHCIPVDSSTIIYWMSLFVILGVLALFCRFFLLLMENPGSEKGRLRSDATYYQTPHYMASYLGLHSLPMTL